MHEVLVLGCFHSIELHVVLFFEDMTHDIVSSAHHMYPQHSRPNRASPLEILPADVSGNKGCMIHDSQKIGERPKSLHLYKRWGP